MKLSDYVIGFLVKEGVHHNFEMIGGAIAHLLDSTYEREDIQCVSVHHEQAAAFAAEAYARINGKLGVAMATSGPGALNLLTGIGSCYFDSVPCLFITGQVNTYEYKFDKPVRQIGFQETDIVSVAKPLTKYAEIVIDPEKIRFQLEKAVYLAQKGRPGPVLLDIPMNIQRAQIDPDKLESFFNSEEFRNMPNNEMMEKQSIADAKLNDVIKLIETSKRPIILVGGGVRLSGAADELNLFVEKTKIPVVSSLMGLDAISHDNPAFFGLIGSYGNRYSNLSLANSDLVLILGSRLDTRQTGTRPDTFARAAKKIHVDIDPVELDAKIKVDIAINCDVKDFLIAINQKLEEWNRNDLSAWYGVIEEYRTKYPTLSPPLEEGGIDPNKFMQLLSSRSSEGDIICLDVGQHQMWASQSFSLKKGQRLLNSGGMGAMGFALPAAIGAAKAAQDKQVIVIAGDGGIQVNIQELDTLVNHNLPVKIFIMNNKNLGMVRVFQDLYFNGRQQSTVTGYGCPDLVAIAKAYKIPAYTISNWENSQTTIDLALGKEGPVLINVELELQTVVNPKLVVNRPIEDMSPHIDRKELEEIMLIDLVEEMEVPV